MQPAAAAATTERPRRLSPEAVVYLLLLAVGLALPLAGAYPVFVMVVLCFALFACSFNLLLGFTGLLSFGHAAFFGAAAYGSGHALRVWGWPTELGLLFGVACSALLGLIVGGLAIRRSGIYFAMITLALAQMVYFFFLQAPFTHGEDGLQGVPRGTLLGALSLDSDLTLYYVVLAVFAGSFLLIRRTVNSPFGQVLKAIRDNEPRAISLGYPAARFKLLAFVLSAALSGLAGAMKTLVLGFAALTDAHWSTSGLVILMVLVGGMGTLIGPIVGALIIIGLENKVGDIGVALAHWTGVAWFGGLGEAATIVTGLIFVVCVSAFRRGVVGELLAWWQRRHAGAA
jgi:branched-chain amino acid transport system permease protein